MTDRRYVPKFEGPIEGYVVNYLRRNFWRLQGTMEYEDAMQEAQVVFLKLVDRYAGVDAPHFMALFKTAWRNRVTDLALTDTALRAFALESQVAAHEDGGYTSALDEAVGELENSGYLLRLIAEAPDDVRTVLSFFFNAPDSIVVAVSAAWRKSGRRRDQGNRMLCEVLGLPPGTDVLGRVLRHFSA